jgi:hypothetical protein
MPAAANDENIGYTGFSRALLALYGDRELLIAATQATVFVCVFDWDSRLKLIASWRFHTRPEEERNCRGVAIAALNLLPGHLLAVQSQCGHVRILSLVSVFQAFFRLGKEVLIHPADVLYSFEPTYFSGCGNCGLLQSCFYVYPGYLVSFNAIDRVHNDMNCNVYSFSSRSAPQLLYSFSLEANRIGQIFLRQRPEQLPIPDTEESRRLRQWLEDLFAAASLSMRFHLSDKGTGKVRYHFLNERTLLSIDEKLRVFISREAGDDTWELFPDDSQQDEKTTEGNAMQFGAPTRVFAGSALVGGQLIVAVTETAKRSTMALSPSNARSSDSSTPASRRSSSVGGGGGRPPSSPYKRRSVGSLIGDDQPAPSVSILYTWSVFTRQLLSRRPINEQPGPMKQWLADSDP